MRSLVQQCLVVYTTDLDNKEKLRRNLAKSRVHFVLFKYLKGNATQNKNMPFLIDFMI